MEEVSSFIFTGDNPAPSLPLDGSTARRVLPKHGSWRFRPDWVGGWQGVTWSLPHPYWLPGWHEPLHCLRGSIWVLALNSGTVGPLAGGTAATGSTLGRVLSAAAVRPALEHPGHREPGCGRFEDRVFSMTVVPWGCLIPHTALEPAKQKARLVLAGKSWPGLQPVHLANVSHVWSEGRCCTRELQVLPVIVGHPEDKPCHTS